MKNTAKISLKLFNAVVAKEGGKPEFIEEHGVFVDSQASWAIKDIRTHLHQLKLSGEDLNKTFHKSWKKIQSSSRVELLIEQIMHYMSTYGTNFEGEVYIPDEVLKVPETKLSVSVIQALSKKEMTEKALDLLRSGIALTQETLKEVFSLLESLKYKFTGKEGIRNKEANIVLAEKFGIYPNNAEEFLRFLVYVATEQTSLVKSEEMINLIKVSKANVSKHIKKYGVEKLAPVFNRFKPIFLAFKKSHKKNVTLINQISKKSKTMHKPMPQNALNLVTQQKLTKKDTHWLDNATPYALFKALTACYIRKEGQTSFVYRVRNGKSWVQESTTNVNICIHNYKFILDYLKANYNGEGKTVLIPEDIVYALPTSEKLFVGNIPTGTKFLGKKLAAGIYWENSWGANDLDLSGLNIEGKIGWNSDYYSDTQQLTYSGDLTSAPNGAVEYLHAANDGDLPATLVMNNVFSGSATCEYKIVVGKGPKVSRKYMMDPNKVMAEIKTSSVQKNSVLGMLMKEDSELVSFTLLNFGAGNARVAGNSEVSKVATKALYDQWKNPLSLNEVLKELDYNVVSEFNAANEEKVLDFDLQFDKITKSTFIEMFSQ